MYIEREREFGKNRMSSTCLPRLVIATPAIPSREEAAPYAARPGELAVTASSWGQHKRGRRGSNSLPDRLSWRDVTRCAKYGNI